MNRKRPTREAHPSYDHDDTYRHHHDADTGDPVWWGNCDQFGGEKRWHRHYGSFIVGDEPEPVR